MAAEMTGAGSEQITLAGFVTLQGLATILTEVWRVARQKPGTRFRFECSEVTDFSCHALAELVKLRRDVRSTGGDLALTGLSELLWHSLKDSLFQALVLGERRRAKKPLPLQGPHHPGPIKSKSVKAVKQKRRQPYFLGLRGARYQRFWLN